MRLKFVEPLMPTLVVKPPEGDTWIHEVKFDGYRSQIVIDEEGTRLFTGLDWTSNIATSPQQVPRSAPRAHHRRRDHRSQRQGLFDFAALRKAITRRQHDLYFVAFDLLHLNGHDLRDMALEERQATQWVKPGLVGRVKHLRGEEGLRHASLQDFREET